MNMEREQLLRDMPYGVAGTQALADIRDVSVDRSLSRKERIAEFIRQIGNPYCFKCGEFTVRAHFAEDGATLEDCLRSILL